MLKTYTEVEIPNTLRIDGKFNKVVLGNKTGKWGYYAGTTPPVGAEGKSRMRLTIGAEGRAAAGGAPEGGKVAAPPGAGAAPGAGGRPTRGGAPCEAPAGGGAPPTLLLLLTGVLPCGEGVCPKVGG